MEMSSNIDLNKSSDSQDQVVIQNNLKPAMEAGQFTIIDKNNEADKSALKTVNKQLSPQGFIANLVDKVWNRGIAAIFSSEQRQLNAARDLLAKPTEDLTTAINRFAQLNQTVQKHDGIPVTLENVVEYADALRSGMILVEVEGLEGSKVEPKAVEDLQFFIQTAFRDIADQVAALNRGYKDPSPIVTAAKTVSAWRDAIQTAGKTLSDAEFRGLVTQANENVGKAGANQAFVESNTVTTWAQVDKMGQEKFVNETAQEFAEAVKGIEGEDYDGASIQALIDKVENRATKINEILEAEDVDGIKEALLNSMNGVPGFKEALMDAQDSLKTVITNNQSHEFLAREQMVHLTESQEGIIDSVKNTIEGSQLKGEAAIVGTFGPLLVPEITIDTVRHAGNPELLSKGENAQLQGQFVDVAEAANKGFNGHLAQLNTLLTEGNKSKVVKGQESAEDALYKLELINGLISQANQDEEVAENRTWTVDIEDINKPIPVENQNAASVAAASKEAFLTMIEKLAGTSDEEASPTLLEQLLTSLGTEGRTTVLGQEFDPQLMFEKVQRDGNTVTYKETTMLQFAGEKPEAKKEDLRSIAELREKVRAIREEQAEVLRQEQAEIIEAARIEKEANPTTTMKIRNWLSTHNPFAKKPSEKNPVITEVSLDADEVAQKTGIGTKIANWFKNLKPFGVIKSRKPVEPMSQEEAKKLFVGQNPTDLNRRKSMSDIQEPDSTSANLKRRSSVMVLLDLNEDQ